MFNKIALASKVWSSNLSLFVLITLTIYLPIDLLQIFSLNYFSTKYHYIISNIYTLISLIFSIIAQGAIIFAIYRIHQKESVTYASALRQGLEKWGKYFVASFIAGIFIFLGLVALIIPGIILAVRYAFIGYPIIIENVGVDEARHISVKLTKGRRWDIFGVSLLIYVVLYIPYIVILISFSLTSNIYFITLAGLIINVLMIILTNALFLYYVEAKEKESVRLQIQPSS